MDDRRFPLPKLSSTWWLFGDDLYNDMTEFAKVDDSKQSLEQTLFKRLSIEPTRDLAGGHQRLVGARYEFPTYSQQFLYEEAKIRGIDNAVAWMDFLCGLPYGIAEMLIIVGEVSTKREKWPFLQGGDVPIPPMPDNLFEERDFTTPRVIHNYCYIQPDRVEFISDGVGSEADPSAPNWWMRINLVGDDTYPYPGEFVGLTIRMFPTLVAGMQRYSPYLYSGHWFDTTVLTSGEALVIEESPEGYYVCVVFWRKEKEVRVYPTDFACYKPGDRITIVKDVSVTKTSQLWRDDDCFTMDQDIWRAVPLTFYGRGFEE